MRKKSDPLAPLFAALTKLDQVGAEERVIAVLCHSLSGDGPRSPAEVYAEVKWRSADVDRKRTAALMALRKALKTCPHELPAEPLAWLRGESGPPCYIPGPVRDELRALVCNAQPEQTLFDEAIG